MPILSHEEKFIMHSATLSNQKCLSGRFALSVFLAGLALLAGFTPPVMGALPAYCDANALRAFPEMPGSLKCTPAPEPYIVDGSGNQTSISPSIIKNKAAAIALGKIVRERCSAQQVYADDQTVACNLIRQCLVLTRVHAV